MTKKLSAEELEEIGEMAYKRFLSRNRPWRIALRYRKKITALESEQWKIRAEVWREAAKEIPSSWLHPILTGPDSVKTSDCKETECLLNAVRKILSDRATECERKAKGK